MDFSRYKDDSTKVFSSPEKSFYLYGHFEGQILTPFLKKFFKKTAGFPKGTFGKPAFNCSHRFFAKKLIHYDLMEVNNILAEPKYFFPQTRIALCLECSKRFEAIRLLYAQKSKHGDNPFVAKLKHAQIGSAGYIDIPIGKETIRFTATHLAEIQEILRTMPR